jgi:hypothetical protein
MRLSGIGVDRCGGVFDLVQKHMLHWLACMHEGAFCWGKAMRGQCTLGQKKMI